MKKILAFILVSLLSIIVYISCWYLLLGLALSCIGGFGSCGFKETGYFYIFAAISLEIAIIIIFKLKLKADLTTIIIAAILPVILIQSFFFLRNNYEIWEYNEKRNLEFTKSNQAIDSISLGEVVLVPGENTVDNKSLYLAIPMTLSNTVDVNDIENVVNVDATAIENNNPSCYVNFEPTYGYKVKRTLSDTDEWVDMGWPHEGPERLDAGKYYLIQELSLPKTPDCNVDSLLTAVDIKDVKAKINERPTKEVSPFYLFITRF